MCQRQSSRQVPQGGADSALCSHRVAARRKSFVMQAVDKPLFGKAERGAQARASGPTTMNVVGVIDELVGSWRDPEGHLEDCKPPPPRSTYARTSR